MVDVSPWLRVKALYESGGKVSSGVREMAESVLGEKFAKPMKPARRPDFRDREANDDSFVDGGGKVEL